MSDGLVDPRELLAAVEAREADPEWVVICGAMAHPHLVLELPLSMPRFPSRACGLIWGAMLAVASEAGTVTSMTVLDHLRTHDFIDDVGLSVVADLRRFNPSETETRQAAGIVCEEWRRRSMQTALAALTADARSQAVPVDTVLDDWTAEVERLRGSARGTEEDLGELAALVLHMAEHGSGRGPASGYADWDKRSGGLTTGDLHVIAARTSVGKTAFALGPVWHRAVTMGEPAAYLTLEMAPKVIAARIVSQMSGVSLKDIMRGDVRGSEWAELTEAAAKLGESPLKVLAPSSPTLTEVLGTIGRMVNAGCRLIAIDQLSQIQPPSSDRHDIGLKAITSALKAAAMRHDIAIVLLHQINRGVEGRENKRPMASDLRDASIEDDCDTITGLFRAEHYMRQLGKSVPENMRNIGEATLLKVRNGEPGMVPMAFVGECARWSDLAAGSDYV